MRMWIRSCLTASALVGLTACDTTMMVLQDRHGDPVKRYANATQPQGVIDVKNEYSYRFMDKWRISHVWLSGINVRNCQYPLNVYRVRGGYGELGEERNGPFVERDGVLGNLVEHKGQWSVSTSYENIYGTNGQGKFERYNGFCSSFFLSSRNGFGLYIIKPDPAKGTNEWIEGAKAVHLNGVTWLFKEIPPRDMTGSMEGLAATIEIWTLKIPDTPYWLTLKFSTDLKYSIQERFEQHIGMLNLFHRIVASVKLEPIVPINVDLQTAKEKR